MPINPQATFMGAGVTETFVTDPVTGQQARVDVNGNIGSCNADPVTGAKAGVGTFNLSDDQPVTAQQLLVAAVNLMINDVLGGLDRRRGINGAAFIADPRQPLQEPTLYEMLALILGELRSMNLVLRQLPVASREIDDPPILDDPYMAITFQQ